MTTRCLFQAGIFALAVSFCLSQATGEEANQQPEKEPFAAYEAEITGDRVNIRSGPGQNFTRLMRANEGYRVIVIDQHGEWLRIAMPPECLLWIHSDYMRQQSDSNTGVVTGSRVNVRVGPEPKADVVGQVTRGMAVVITARIGKWYEIRPPSTTSACVHSDFVKRVEPGK